MLAAEKQLLPPDMVSKSFEQIQILATIKYNKIIFLRSQGQLINGKILQDAATEDKVATAGRRPTERVLHLTLTS